MTKDLKTTSTDFSLGTQRIPSLIVRMALPSIFAQLINVLYNIVDRIYIGHIKNTGSAALTGIGVAFPILILISAFSYFVGAGGAPLAAIQLGKGKKENAEKILGNSFSILLFLSIFLTIFFQLTKEPLLYLFGASDDTIPYALDYLTVYLWGTIFVQLSLGLNLFITSQGFPRIAMLSVLIGAISNIILDPIFIFVFGLGVKGAACATIVSQAFSAIWVLYFLFSKKCILKIKLENMKPDFHVVSSVLALGVSPFVMQVTECLISIVFNRGLKTYGGDIYVGSMTILQSTMQLFTVPINGFTQGIQPIISYNYGAGKKDRVKTTFRISLVTSVIITTCATLVTAFFPTVFARLFTTEVALIEVVKKALPIFMAGIWIFGVQLACQSAFMGLGQAKVSLFLALLRKVILLIPLALILPKFFGVYGIYYSEPIADTLAALTTGVMFYTLFEKILNHEDTTA